MVDWNAISAIASVISMVAFVLTALYVRAELKAIEKDRYLAITNQLFSVWQTRDFMDAQLWLLHRLDEKSWPDFVQAHRGDMGEACFHRVGSFYDRVGTLIRLGMVRQEEMLPTIGAYAIAVWQKIHPLVREARSVEHSTLFQDFERLLPSCYECYVPALGKTGPVQLLGGRAEESKATAVKKISIAALKDRLAQAKPVTLLDVRHAGQVASEPQALPGAILMPADTVEQRYQELPSGQEVVTYCA